MISITELKHGTYKLITGNRAIAEIMRKTNKKISSGIIIDMIYIDKPYRGMGIGGRVLKEIISKNKSLDIYIEIDHDFLSEENQDAEAIEGWYRKVGFEDFSNQETNILILKNLS